MKEYEQLDRLTGISVIPENNFSTLESTLVLGPCEWFITKPSFTTWKEKKPGIRTIFWLTGNVGSGKSYLTSRVITELQNHNYPCSYFFFKKGSSPESSIITCLRSLANQMARSDDTILRRLLEMQERSSSLWGNWDNWDDQTMWRKLFLGCIFKDPKPQNHFWVIDAVDGCQKSQSFLNFLTNAPPELRIFFTSRSDLGTEKRCECVKESVQHYQIQTEDTLGDLKILIHHRLKNVLAINDNSREHFKQKILEKASGSFLWVSLVMGRLEEAFSEEQAEEILNEVPTDMGDLYGEMLGNVLQNRHAIALARSLYMWTLLSLRPLNIAVLQCALRLDTQQTVHNLEKLVPAISGRLVFVNKKQEVEAIHETAKSYLPQQKTHPELALCNPKCHTQIARICLALLAGDFTKLQQSQVPKRPSIPSTSVIVPNFADYVCEYFSDHLQRSLSEDNNNWDLLCKFLNCNLLVWIEFLAKKGRVRSVTRTAQNLQVYFRRRLKYLSPISPQKGAMEAWICDIFKLNAKFGTSLALSPSSIRHLIPSMCPSESMVAKYLNPLSQDTGFNIKGLIDRAWDDCLARIDYIDYQVSAIACGEQYSAVALSDGSIQLYFPDSAQVQATLNHDGRVTVLSFSNEDQYLASSGSRKVKVWNPSEGGLLWAVDTSHQILALFFIENEFTLAGATQGNYVVNWDLHDGQEISRWQWTESIRSTTDAKKTWPQPSRAVFSPKHSLLAVSYRGLPLHLFEITNQRFLGLLNRDCGAALTVTVNHYIIEAFAFNPSPEINILLASYGDGELVVYDVDSKQPLNRMKDVFAQCLKCSPDGRTLVTGSSRGTLQIFEFAGTKGERLLPLYTINAQDDGIRDLAFSRDSLRFADIRGSQYRVWEPAVLAHTDIDAGSQSELSHAVSVETRSVGMLEGPLDPEITAMCCHTSGSFVFCGTKDGSVCYFETSTAIKRRVLYRHASNIGITCILFIEKSHLLVTADESGRVLINNIAVSDTGYEFISCAAEIRSDKSLSKLLQDVSGAKILLRGKGTAEIWTVAGQRVGKILSGDYADAQFTSHPLHPDYFVSIGLQGLRIFSWADGLDVEQFRGGQSVDFKITPPTPTATPTAHCFSRKQTSISCDEPCNPPFLVRLFEQGSKKSLHGGSSLDIWPASSLTTSTSLPPTIPLGKFGRYTHRIRQIITTVESMVIFLDNDLWICSIDVYNLSTISSGARRHFFLLSEWQSIYGGFIVEYISSTRQFVVSKKHELLVISRGLEFEEPWIVQAHVS
jgi:WD40 repeat protein